MQSPMNQSEKLEVGKEYPGTDYCRMTESEGQRSTGRGPCAKWGESDRSCMCVDHRVPPMPPPLFGGLKSRWVRVGRWTTTCLRNRPFIGFDVSSVRYCATAIVPIGSVS